MRGNNTKKKYIVALVLILFCAALFFSIFSENFKDWTGFPADKIPSDINVTSVRIYQQSKTLWDWLQLLIVPLTLVVIAYLINETQQKRQLETEQNKKNQDTLDTYFNRMTELLLKENLRISPIDSEVRSVARTLTLTALKHVDGKRKGQIVQFLYEAKLIYKGRDITVINLDHADLTEADLSNLRLGQASFPYCDFSKANLKGAWLKGANLAQSYFYQSNLEEAILDYAGLEYALFPEANLKKAHLWSASCEFTHFERANLNGVMLGSEPSLVKENGELLEVSAKLSSDNGDFAASFGDADLTDAVVMNSQLKYVLLNNATMPDGTKYEKWLKNQDNEFKEIREKVDLKNKDRYNEYKKKNTKMRWKRFVGI